MDEIIIDWIANGQYRGLVQREDAMFVLFDECERIKIEAFTTAEIVRRIRRIEFDRMSDFEYITEQGAKLDKSRRYYKNEDV